MANGPSRSQKVAAWIQTIAILLAGVWAAYEFIFKEQAKAPNINPRLNVTLLKRGEAQGNDLLPVEVEAVVNNTSNSEATVVAGFIALWVHKAAPEANQIVKVGLTTEGGRNDMVMDKVNWSHKTKLAGFATAFPDFRYGPNETSSEKFVFFVPAGAYDILEAKLTFFVANSCLGFYPFERCHKFKATFHWDAREECAEKDKIVGNNWCANFEVGKISDESLRPLTIQEQNESFGFQKFSTTQMTLLPNAPILRSGLASDEAKAD